MKLLPLLFLGLFLTTGTPGWMTDFSSAKQSAKSSHKFILLNFSGSDWCTPCIRMHKTIFESTAFQGYSEKELVLVNADFPRLAKNRLNKTQEAQNDALAERYNPEGKFPLTLLLTEEGKVVRTWEGCPAESADAFVEELNKSMHAGH